MTDTELIEYLGLAGDPLAQVYIDTFTTHTRETYERMKTAEEDIKLWQAGVGPKPEGVILCHDHTKNRGEK